MEKNTQQIKVLVGERLEGELRALAAREDRSLSDYLRWVLARHVWGHGNTQPPETTGSNRDE